VNEKETAFPPGRLARERRKALGLTAADIASRLRTSRVLITRWERGDTTMGLPLVGRMDAELQLAGKLVEALLQAWVDEARLGLSVTCL
jgi:transcriptional regulator with XRE-family HTH domain